jgi:long-subunit fatty acid transport protein
VSLDFPWIFRLGVRYHDADLWSVELASVIELWSALDTIDVSPGGDGIAFVGVPGIGRYSVKPFSIESHYLDVFSLRLGGWWSPGAGDFTVRAGVFYENGAAPSRTLTVLDIDGDKIGIGLGGTVRLGKLQIDLTAAYIDTFQRAVPNSDKTQVNPIYDADDKPYGDTEPSYVGNGTYSAKNFILATTFSAGF